MSKRKRVAFWALLIFVLVLFAAAIKPYLHDRSNNAEVSRADVSSDESAEDADSGENPSDEVPLSEQERQIEEAHITVGLKGSEEMIVKQGDPFINPGAFAIDDRTGPLSIAAERGHVDTGTPGEYHISYTFSVHSCPCQVFRHKCFFAVSVRFLRSVQKTHMKTVPGIVWNLYEAYRFQLEFSLRKTSRVSCTAFNR